MAKHETPLAGEHGGPNYQLIGPHMLITGMTGSGKSIGAAWSIIGELITQDGPVNR
ncbi:hypothetical protein GT755_09790 [Herbidospora sp. NEAU-GS84]|uniref:Uncharacterized protein n=1 Tax=Herbidospora solisilvae TaxID=2696284 RepID=A0A7C9NDK7_9ACTN|nr:ATP-binding protein [Herbidospora solisilvae]NAS21975.1 hypothetical protein [Herbidospora solisilvae]